MPRLMGVDIPGKKHSRFALRYIHGIGPKRADDVLAACKIDPAKKADDLTQDEIHAITTFIQDNYRVEGDLRRRIAGCATRRGFRCAGSARRPTRRRARATARRLPR